MPFTPHFNKLTPPQGFKIPGGFTPHGGTHLADGGIPSSSDMSPWYARKAEEDSLHTQGLLASPVAGRTDLLNRQVPAGAYVIPADVVSGLGEGNTMAGSNILDKILSTGPHGIGLPRVRGEMGPPRAPAPYHEPTYAKGGATGGNVPVVLAGGEFLVHPDDVARLGGGNLDHGHQILDKFVVHVRNKVAKKMLKLPGPVGAKK